MKLKTMFVIALSTVGLLAIGPPSASATTLEIGGVVQNKEVKFAATLTNSALFASTSGTFVNTCLSSTLEGNNEKITAAVMNGPITALGFGNCVENVFVVDARGTFTLENIAGTTNGTLRSVGAKFTMPSPFGVLTCTTAAAPGTDIGTLTGVAAGAATIDINAVLSCGAILPSVKWTATYSVTNPAGLGVV